MISRFHVGMFRGSLTFAVRDSLDLVDHWFGARFGLSLSISTPAF